MNVIFSEHALQEYLVWQKTDRSMVKRINALIREIPRTPFEGIGKPERLQHALSGYWSRRITDEHRIVFKVEGDVVLIAQLRYPTWS